MKRTRVGVLSYKRLSGALGSPVRWRMLEELSKGGLFSVTELSVKTGLSLTGASKHVAILVAAGIVVRGKGRLISLAPEVLGEDGAREVRLGKCTLHF